MRYKHFFEQYIERENYINAAEILDEFVSEYEYGLTLTKYIQSQNVRIDHDDTDRDGNGTWNGGYISTSDDPDMNGLKGDGITITKEIWKIARKKAWEDKGKDQ